MRASGAGHPDRLGLEIVAGLIGMEHRRAVLEPDPRRHAHDVDDRIGRGRLHRLARILLSALGLDEEAQKAIDDENLVIVSGFIKDKPDIREDGGVEYDETPVEDMAGPVSDIPMPGYAAAARYY